MTTVRAKPDTRHARPGTRIIGVFALLALTVLSAPAFAQPDSSPDILLDPQDMARIESAVDRGLAYLVQKQSPDGSFPSWSGKNVAIDGLSLLAFLGRGHVPGQGPYWPAVNKSVAYIMSTQDTAGVYRSPQASNGPMYEHGLATLAMIEAYGFIPTSAMRTSVQNAVDLIVRAQSAQGGWRYQPQPADADLSATVMQIVALHAAMNARLKVPEETVQKAMAYVRSVAVPGGGFGYQGPSAPNLARTAAGVLSLQLLGAYDDPAVKAGLEYLDRGNLTVGGDGGLYWYTTYYSMQAAYQAGGDHWAKWHPKVREALLGLQNTDGSWPGLTEQQFNNTSAACYSTAMGCIALEVYMHYLPAYQR